MAKEDNRNMKNSEKYSKFETSGGKYSSRKVPRWDFGHHELMEYLDFMKNDWDDHNYQLYPA